MYTPTLESGETEVFGGIDYSKAPATQVSTGLVLPTGVNIILNYTSYCHSACRILSMVQH